MSIYFTVFLKIRKYLYLFVGLLVVCFIIYFSSDWNNSNNKIKSSDNLAGSPQQVLETYLKSVKEEKIEDIIANSKDSRFKNESEARDNYTTGLKEMPLKEYKIKSIKNVDAQNVKILTSVKWGNQDPSDFTFTLIMEDKKWKVFFPKNP